ncbi:MAG: hypothetical protein QOI57_670 [Rubrobacteraceae bacterium]|nr:hypothetical protein [Rubrobacteraceae bacterium]
MESFTPLDALRFFPDSLYRCFVRRAEALFELEDAVLLTAGIVPSPVHLSLQPSHRRGWGSLYAALDRGRIDAETLRKLLAGHPLLAGGEPPVYYAVDVIACGLVVTRRVVAHSAATTTTPRVTRPGSPSSPGGPTNGWPNYSAWSATAGLPRWTWYASIPRRIPTWSPPSRSRPCSADCQGKRPFLYLSSTPATIPCGCSKKGLRVVGARSSSVCAPVAASRPIRAGRLLRLAGRVAMGASLSARTRAPGPGALGRARLRARLRARRLRNGARARLGWVAPQGL